MLKESTPSCNSHNESKNNKCEFNSAYEFHYHAAEEGDIPKVIRLQARAAAPVMPRSTRDSGESQPSKIPSEVWRRLWLCMPGRTRSLIWVDTVAALAVLGVLRLLPHMWKLCESCDCKL